MANSSFQEIFDLSTKFLNEKKYHEVTQSLGEIRSQGFTSASIEATLGRSLFEEGKPGESMSHFLNAISLDRLNPDYRQNLKVAQEKANAKMNSQMASTLQHPAEWGNLISSYVRPAELFSGASLLLLMAIGLKLSQSSFKNPKPPLRFLLFLVVLGTALGTFSLTGRSIAIVTETSSVRIAPLESAEVRIEVPSGARVRIIRSSDDYVEIERPNSFKGWVLASHISRSPF